MTATTVSAATQGQSKIPSAIETGRIDVQNMPVPLLNVHDIGWAPPPCSPPGSSLSCTSSASQPDWQPLIAAAGEVAAGTVMIAVIAARTRR